MSKTDAPSTRFAPRPRWRARLTALVCVALQLLTPLVPAARAETQLPALGDPAADEFSLATEHKLGEAIMHEIRADPDYLDDPVLLEYLQAIWQKLLAQSRARGNITLELDQRWPWEPFLVRDKEVNAFALPGGYIGVNLGLIAMTSTRDELASVLAHEMSHITQRHIARSIANSKHQSLLGIAALLAGLVVASRSGSSTGDAANAAIVGSQALSAQGQLNFSRDMEREADRVGWQVMTGAGFAPNGMADMFEKLDMASRLNDFGNYPYLRSHPLTSERIGEAKARMGTAPPAPAVSRLEHTAAQARARVLMDTRVGALRRWQSLDSDRSATTPADQLLAAYESALSSTLLRDWSRADASIATAAEIVRKAESADTRSTLEGGDRRAQRAIALLNVQSLLARGDAFRAGNALAPYAADGSRPVLMLSAQIALAAAGGTAVVSDNAGLKQTGEQLRTWTAVHPRDALAWTWLKQVDERLGLPLLAVRADAESRVAIADFDGAAERLQSGQRRARSGVAPVDFIDLSVIDARLRDVEALRRQQKEDERSLR